LKKIFLILFFISLSNIALAGNCKGIWVDKVADLHSLMEKKLKLSEEWFEQWKK